MYNYNSVFYIIYAENYDNFRFYISNTDPIIWSQDICFSKIYSNSKTAEYNIVGDYYNYRDIKKLLEDKNISGIFIGEYSTDYQELRRVKIL